MTIFLKRGIQKVSKKRRYYSPRFKSKVALTAVSQFTTYLGFMARQAGTVRAMMNWKDLGGWKSRNMVDRYAKFATENLNAIESVNMSLRKVSKNRSSFPNDEAVTKLFYLALINISKKWTMPLRDWKPALNRFTIQFEERMPQQ